MEYWQWGLLILFALMLISYYVWPCWGSNYYDPVKWRCMPMMPLAPCGASNPCPAGQACVNGVCATAPP